MRCRPLLALTITLFGGLLLQWSSVTPDTGHALADPLVALEQRVEIVIKNYDFLLSQHAAIRLHAPTVVILRNQDIVRHGFTSPMLMNLLVLGEGEGVVAYGKGVEGFYIDPGKTLVIRFTPERTGNYSFKCDLHPQMKSELYMLEIPAA